MIPISFRSKVKRPGFSIVSGLCARHNHVQYTQDGVQRLRNSALCSSWPKHKGHQVCALSSRPRLLRALWSPLSGIVSSTRSLHKTARHNSPLQRITQIALSTRPTQHRHCSSGLKMCQDDKASRDVLPTNVIPRFVYFSALLHC